MNTKQQQQPATLLPSYETLMAQAQVFASAWAIAGSKFDAGEGIKVANQEKANLADMFRRLHAENEILHAENESLRASFDTLRTGYDAARQEIASLTAQPYDQQAMGLCHVCGWKGVIDYPDGPVCVACEYDKTLSPQPTAQALHVAATSCPHEIDKDKIVLHFDSKQPGKNALAQLAARLQAAQAQHVHWVTPTIAQMKEYCKQASAMMARDLTRFDAACEVMGYLKEMRAPGYYMHRMNIVLHGNVEGTDAARASDKAPQPAAQALDSVRVFWQQHTQADALSMTIAELHADVELVIRAAPSSAAPQPAAQAAPTFAAKLPSPANVGTAPKCLNHNDQAMWVLGWNECLDAASAAQKGNHD